MPPGNLLSQTQLSQLTEPSDYFFGIPFLSPTIPQNVMLFVRKDKDWIDLRKYFHHRFVLLCVLDGEGEIIVDGQSFLLKKHHCFMLSPHQIHSYRNVRESQKINWLFITFEAPVTGKTQALENISIPLKGLPKRYLNALLASYLATRNHRDELFHSNEVILHASLLLNALLRGRRETRNAEALAYESDELIAKVRELIWQNMESSLTIKEIAAYVSVPANYLGKKFKAKTGIRLSDFIQQERLQRAQALLMQSNLSLTEISDKCGFQNQSAFTRFFKERKKISPRTYRQQLRTGFKDSPRQLRH